MNKQEKHLKFMPMIENAASAGQEVPFHRPYITEDEISEVVDSLRSGWLTMGPKTLAFENGFRGYIGSGHAVSMNSCTACLHLALQAIGLKEGNEVIIPAITFASSAEVVFYFKGKPVFVDVDEKTRNIDISRIEEHITPKTSAIMPVHYAGQPCDMDEILEIAHRHGLFVIEDAAHAIPATYRNKKVGTIGDITCFSFYATKTLTTGEGGMATTDNGDWADRMRTLRLHGISSDAWKRYTKEGSWYYEIKECGYKYNMTDIQAALGIAQLKKVELMKERRKEISRRYTQVFSCHDEIITPHVKSDRESAWHLYTVLLNLEMLSIDRNRFIEELKLRGIGTSVHFIPLYRHPYYRENCEFRIEAFPASERVYERTVSLPLYPGMTDIDVLRVMEAVTDVIKTYRR